MLTLAYPASSRLPLPLLLDPNLALSSVIIPEDEIYLP